MQGLKLAGKNLDEIAQDEKSKILLQDGLDKESEN